MTFESSDLVEAVVLFAGDRVSREMLYPEFEAILDGFVPVPDYKGGTAKAAYLTINPQLKITSSVFFLLDFDEKGMVDRRWNVPLRQLSQISGKGPDLGAGPIRLACYSQCAIAWQQKKLWDPNMDPTNNSFGLLKKAIQNNRLGLVVKAAPIDDEPPKLTDAVSLLDADLSSKQKVLQQKLHEQYAQALRDRVAAAIKEQRLRITTLQSKHKNDLQKLQQEHHKRLEAYQQKMHSLETQVAELETRNHTLKENFEIQANKVEGMREYFTHKLKSAQQDESSQLQTLQENFAMELDVKVQAATAELREMLDMREVELFYRHQSETALKEEIVNIKRENQNLLRNTGDEILTRLEKAGINLVVYHPGVGQFTLTQADLTDYLENTMGFVATKIGVSETLYTHWLSHYQHPVCTAANAAGQACGHAVSRIGSPMEFHEGESDRCEQHQAIVYKRVAESR